MARRAAVMLLPSREKPGVATTLSIACFATSIDPIFVLEYRSPRFTLSFRCSVQEGVPVFRGSKYQEPLMVGVCVDFTNSPHMPGAASMHPGPYSPIGK